MQSCSSSKTDLAGSSVAFLHAHFGMFSKFGDALVHIMSPPMEGAIKFLATASARPEVQWPTP